MFKIWLKHKLTESAINTFFDKLLANFSIKKGTLTVKEGETYRYIDLQTYLELDDGHIITNVSMRLENVEVDTFQSYDDADECWVWVESTKITCSTVKDIERVYEEYFNDSAVIEYIDEYTVAIYERLDWFIDPADIVQVVK